MPENDLHLPLVEGDILLFGAPLARYRVAVAQPFDDLAVQDRLLDDLRDVFGLHALVEDPLGADHQDRAALAETVTAGCLETDLVRELPLAYLGDEGLADGRAPQGTATRVAQRYAG